MKPCFCVATNAFFCGNYNERNYLKKTTNAQSLQFPLHQMPFKCNFFFFLNQNYIPESCNKWSSINKTNVTHYQHALSHLFHMFTLAITTGHTVEIFNILIPIKWLVLLLKYNLYHAVWSKQHKCWSLIFMSVGSNSWQKF